MPLFTLRLSALPRSLRLKVNPRKPVSQLKTQNRAPSTGNREQGTTFMFLALGQAGSFSAYQFRGVKTSRSSSRAFTLIELLVVIAIIAIRIWPSI